MPKIIEEKSEKKLIDLAMQGEKEAFGSLYEIYLDHVFRYIYFRIGNKEDAEDITEKVFIKTWNHISQNKSRSRISNFRAWIYRIAHNLVVDHYRKKKPKHEEVNEDLQTNEKPIEVIVEENMKYQALYKIICQLDERMQQIIILRFINGHSHDETAKIVGIKPGHVRVLQYRALKHLRGLMMEQDI